MNGDRRSSKSVFLICAEYTSDALRSRLYLWIFFPSAGGGSMFLACVSDCDGSGCCTAGEFFWLEEEGLEHMHSFPPAPLKQLRGSPSKNCRLFEVETRYIII